MPHTHRLLATVELAPDGDERALGGAVTQRLCGHWVHDGTCRWPHLTEVARRDGQRVDVQIHLSPGDSDVEELRWLVVAALEHGRLTGPDGRVTSWRLVRAGPMKCGPGV